MRVQALASGSKGNATLIEIGETRLLVDAGLSARELTRRLARADVAPESIDALVLSHEHEDHARGAEVFSRRHGVPVICSYETLEAMDRSPSHFASWRAMAPGRVFDVDGLEVDPFPVPHDAVSPVGFVVRGALATVGLVTDLGHVTSLVVERLRGCHVLVVEANHDERMLRDGPYPWHLKQRVSGRLGHLSNREASAMLREAAGPWTRAVVIAHLSERNNSPALARTAAAEALAAAGCRRVEMRVAASDRPTPAVVV